MHGENSDLGELQRERAQREAALAEVAAKIAAIEEKARLAREESEQRERELALLQRKLVNCREMVGWTEKKIADLKQIAEGQLAQMLGGASEAFLTVKMTLEEVSQWERLLLVLREYEASLPAEIEKLTAISSQGA